LPASVNIAQSEPLTTLTANLAYGFVAFANFDNIAATVTWFFIKTTWF
jgi:hypothetical protein